MLHVVTDLCVTCWPYVKTILQVSAYLLPFALSPWWVKINYSQPVGSQQSNSYYIFNQSHAFLYDQQNEFAVVWLGPHECTLPLTFMITFVPYPPPPPPPGSILVLIIGHLMVYKFLVFSPLGDFIKVLVRVYSRSLPNDIMFAEICIRDTPPLIWKFACTFLGLWFFKVMKVLSIIYSMIYVWTLVENLCHRQFCISSPVPSNSVTPATMEWLQPICTALYPYIYPNVPPISSPSHPPPSPYN